MKKAFLISVVFHLLLFMLMFIAASFAAPMKPPQKIYSVKILPAPTQPETTPAVDEKIKEPEPEEQPPKRKIFPHPASQKKPKPKKQPKPKQETKQETKKRPTKNLTQGAASIMIEGKDFADDFYLNLIITKIANNWLNPLRGGRKISCIIYFRIHRNGEVSNIKVEKKSGNSLFDQSAQRAVMAATPLPTLPESYTGDHLGVHFEFEHTGR